MSHWNYRTAFKRHVINGVEEISYGLVEAYYNDKGDLLLTTERFIEPSGETKEELMAIYRSLIDVMDRQYPQCFGKMYDKIRPKVERYYRERNKQTKRK